MATTWSAILLVLAALRGASSQLDSCPLLEGAITESASCSFNNCTNITCRLSQNEQLIFVVDGCVDPVHVVVTLRSELHESEIQHGFNRSGVISLVGGRTISVNMSRNTTHLDFAVSVSSAGMAPTEVVPQVFVPLTPDRCMCESVTTLAANTGHSFLSPTCRPNPACDGVNCELVVDGVYFIENLILPCIDSIELVVRNENQQVIFTTIFNETGMRPLTIGSLTIMVDVTIITRDYSMDVAAIVDDLLFFGAVEIFPLHTIILDRTHCNLPNFTTLPPPPPPTPLPPPVEGSSPTCRGFHDAVSDLFMEPFICRFLGGNCDDGINCTLYLLNLTYTLTARYVDARQNFVVSVFDEDGRSLGMGNMDLVTVRLPFPANTDLVFIQRTVVMGIKGIQIDLSLPIDVGSNVVHTLLPFSRVPLGMEQCQTLIQATSDPSTTCVANGDCSGLSCDLDASSDTENDMVFVVDKCRDPVVVNVTSFHGGLSMTSLIQNGRIFLGGGEYLAVRMSRNATDLDFRAFITDSTQTEEVRPVVPQVFVPLNASDCMCESMAQLAEISGHSVVETNCVPNSDCNGIMCELNVLGLIFHLQVEVSACDEILFIELLADGSSDPLLLTQVNQSGVRIIEIVSGFPLTIDLTLEGRDYSMLIAATIEEPLFGLVEIVPPHLLILDRTSCNHRNFVTLPPPQPVTPPPSPGSSVSDTCRALYGVVRNHFMEPFACRSLSSCDRGIQCELEILNLSYDVVLSISRDSKSVSVDVQLEGVQLQTRESGSVTNVTLPRPMNSNLSLTQDFDPQRTTVSMQLDLYVFALDGEPRRDVLIPRTEIPIDSSSSKVSTSTIALATAVPILSLVVVVAVVGLIILAVLMMRKKGHSKAFDFQPMQHSELEAKDLENYLDTAEGSLPSTKTGVIAVSAKNGTGSSEAGGGGGGEKTALRDVDLENQNVETNVKGHLV